MDTKNKNDLKNYRPMKFVDQMERNKHILLLYDDQKYVYWIIGRYFHNGFAKGESCIFYTADRPEIIEKQLSAGGIDVNLFKQKNLLRIYEIERSDDNKHDILHTLNQIREESKKKHETPIQIRWWNNNGYRNKRWNEIQHFTRKNWAPAF